MLYAGKLLCSCCPKGGVCCWTPNVEGGVADIPKEGTAKVEAGGANAEVGCVAEPNGVA